MKPVSKDWADGSHTFLLRIGEIEELQDKCDAGPPVIFGRLTQGEWRSQDVRETIRLALIGGGMSASRALQLVQRYVDEPRAVDSVALAAEIVGAWLFGVREVQDDLNEGVEPDPDPNDTARQIDITTLIRAGFNMNIQPEQVRGMTFADFCQCYIAYRNAHRPGRGPVTDEEYDALVELGEKWNAENEAMKDAGD